MSFKKTFQKNSQKIRAPFRFSILLFWVIVVTSVSCLNKNKSQTLPLFMQQAVPYTPEDLGITPPPPNSALAVLPVISETERDKIQSMLTAMSEQGMLTDVALKTSSVAAWEMIKYVPLSDEQLDAKINDAFYAEKRFQEPQPPTLEVLLEKNSMVADYFYGPLIAELPSLTDDQLVELRYSQTQALVVNRLSQDYRDTENGIPLEFLQLSRSKIAAFRDKINEELVRRGVTEL